jgi:hypothetical protein
VVTLGGVVGAVWCAYQNLDTTSSPVALVPGDVVVVQGENTSVAEQVTVLAVASSPPAGSNASANQPPAGTLTWAPGVSYSVGQYASPTAANAKGFWFRCTQPGISGTTEPTWPTQFGAQAVDNGASWIAAGASTVFQAKFLNPHDVGASVLAGNFPYWWSTQRLNVVVVTAAAAVDPTTRAKVDAFLGKALRGVSQWAIVAGTPTPGTSGGTYGGISAGYPQGTQTLGTFTYTHC